jgi:hypothetical protein
LHALFLLLHALFLQHAQFQCEAEDVSEVSLLAPAGDVMRRRQTLPGGHFKSQHCRQQTQTICQTTNSQLLRV